MSLTSFEQGTEAENLFCKIRGSNILRRATPDEDINEHWDVLDSEFGRVDVKSAKRKYRNGPIDNTIWWEIRTVKRPPNYISKNGWGIPNSVYRLVAIQHTDSFILVNPRAMFDEIKKKCRGRGRGEYLLHSRPNRGDVITILPISFINKYKVHEVYI